MNLRCIDGQELSTMTKPKLIAVINRQLKIYENLQSKIEAQEFEILHKTYPPVEQKTLLWCIFNWWRD